MFDLNKVKAHQLRAIKRSKPDADFLSKMLARDIADRVQAANRIFPIVWELHSLSGATSDAIRSLDNVGDIMRFENSHFVELTKNSGGQCELIDIENMAKQPRPNLIIANLGWHYVNDKLGFLSRLVEIANPDCLLLATLPAAGTLAQLAQCLGQAEAEITGNLAMRIDPFPEVREAGSLLQNSGFALPVTDAEEYVVRYDNLRALIDELRSMGAGSSATQARSLPRGVFERAAELYENELCDSDGRIRADFRFVFMTGWTPHESQQQPLKPGSAAHSLKDFL